MGVLVFNKQDYFLWVTDAAVKFSHIYSYMIREFLIITRSTVSDVDLNSVLFHKHLSIPWESKILKFFLRKHFKIFLLKMP